MGKLDVYMEEKARQEAVTVEHPATAGEVADIDHSVDAHNLKRAIFKTDLILVPVSTMIYFLSFLDRTNIGNAKAAGLQKDLGITSNQFSLALTTTYITYIAAEMPLTLAMKKLGPNIMIPTLIIAWGIVTTFQGFIHSYSGLIAARFFLGATEGAILPSLVTVLSTFYPRQQLGKRLAILFCATSLAGAFSGLLAAALVLMEGLGGRRGWQWILIIEGIFTVVFGFGSYWLVPHSPGTAWFLNQGERDALVAQLHRDRPAAEDHEKLNARSVLKALTAPQLWLMFCQFFASGTMLFGLAFFSPTIVSGLGYKGTMIQLRSVPPYVCSTFVSLVFCFYSDRWNHRGSFILLGSIFSIAGYALYLGTDNTQLKARYASLFLQVIGAYAGAPVMSTWMPNNLAPYFRRVTGIVMGFISTNLGGILSTWMFPTSEAPGFHRGTSILLGMACTQMFMCVLNMTYLWNENRMKHNKMVEHSQDGPEGSWEDKDKEGDMSLHFKYVL